MVNYDIQVRNGDNTLIKTIRVRVWSESIGNFMPVFCKYRGRRRLIESDALDLDDPFRCQVEDHVNKMFIRPRDANGRVVATWDAAATRKKKEQVKR